MAVVLGWLAGVEMAARMGEKYTSSMCSLCLWLMEKWWYDGPVFTVVFGKDLEFWSVYDEVGLLLE